MGRPKAASAPFQAYGGQFLRSRKGRSGPRPLALGQPMHFVLRSTRAKGTWSFRHPRNHASVQRILRSFAGRHGVQLLGFTVLLSHLHVQIRVPSARAYQRFIRAVTAAIAMAITGASRWRKLGEKFWDRRPFSRPLPPVRRDRPPRAVDCRAANRLEALGFQRAEARYEDLLLRPPPS